MTPRPLNVLYVRDDLTPSGATGYLQQTLPRFDPARVRPMLLVLGPSSGPAAAVLKSFSIPAISIDRRNRDPRRLIDLFRLARRPRPDLLHLSGTRSMLQGLIIGRLLRVPTLTRINYMVPEDYTAPVAESTILARGWLATDRDHMIAVSQAVRTWAAKTYRIPEASISVLTSGIDVPRFSALATAGRERSRAALMLEPCATVIGLVGRIDLTQKGQDVAIRAMPAILARHPQALLLLVGDGPDRKPCEELTRQLGLEAHVRFTGRRDDIPDVLAAVDVVVVPSVCEESFGLVALEAQAVGRPVVAARSGGLPEVVLDHETGLVVPKRDPSALADAVVRLLDEPALARRLVSNGQVWVRGFTLERQVEELTRLYDRIVAPPR